MTMPNKPQRVLNRYAKMKDHKLPWIPLFELLAEYVMTRKQGFDVEIQPGRFLNSEIFDMTASKSYHLMSSSVIGASWPNAAKTLQIEVPTPLKGTDFEDDETVGWYEYVTKITVEKMDHPRAGLNTALNEYMDDQTVFGTSGISAFENEDDNDVPIQYSSLDVKRMAINEGENGFVDTVYIEKNMDLREVIIKYGYDNVSLPLREKWDKGIIDEKVRVLHAIEPRIEHDKTSFGNLNMPIASIHIEMSSGKVLRESGFHEMPVFVPRFWKAVNEKYGRSPAMEALADILELNAIREATIVAIEKNLDPPLGVFDDGSLGGGTIDTSAGAINVFSVAGRLAGQASNPIQQLVTVGEFSSTYTRITELREEIRNSFLLIDC